MLVHIVTSANKARYVRQIDQMHRQRHDVFVEQAGWEALRRPDGRDVDEYDTEDAEYLICIRGGECLAHLRQCPTTGVHQLMDGGALAHFAQEDVPSGPNVWEASRNIGGLPDVYGRDAMSASINRMRIAAQEWALKRGVTRGVAIAEEQVVRRLESVDLELKPLGEVVEYSDSKVPGRALAVTYAYSADKLHSIRAETDISERVTYESPSAPPGDTPLPFDVFDVFQDMPLEQRASFLNALTPIVGATPPENTEDDAAYDYLVLIEQPAQIAEALDIASIYSEEAA